MAVLAGDCATGHAATINVPADQPTIQDAINVAATGDVVLVAPGTYNEQIQFTGATIQVASVGGPTVTTIDGGGVGPVVTFRVNSTLTGFTITGGNSSSVPYEGGGILVSNAGSPTIFGNIVTGNSACAEGGGIAVEFSSPTIQSNIIENNTQSDCFGGGGAGIFIGGAGAAMILSNTISNNSWSSGDGGGIWMDAAGQVAIMNNLISGNMTTGVFNGGGTPIAMGGGIAMINDSDSAIFQNVIANNQADLGGGVAFEVPSGSMGPLLINNTIIGNSTTQAIGAAVFADGYDGPVGLFNNLMNAPSAQSVVYCDNEFQPYSPVFENNDAYGSGILFDGCDADAGEFGNFSGDPLFVNYGGGDFHLTSGSPAIDAGLNSAANFSVTDYYGNPRIVAGKAGDSAIVDVGAAEYQPPTPVQTPVPTATPTPAPNRINVPAEYSTIQGAINAASNGETIMVAPGRYFEALDFKGKAITVASTAGAAATIIDAHGLGSAVTFSSGEGNASVLSGFTITGGLSQGNGGGIWINNASPTITSNVINNNISCIGGGGIFSNFGSPIIQSNVISNNQQFANSLGACGGGNGGGIQIVGSGNAQIIGNTISGNSWASGDGGGIELSSAGTPLVMNNTISNNLATGVFSGTPQAAGGGISVEGITDARLIQNLVINNTADWGGGIFLSSTSTATVVNNTVAGNTSTQNLGSALYAAKAGASTKLYNNLLIDDARHDALHCAAGIPTLVTNDLFSGGAHAISGTCAKLSGTSGNISKDPKFNSAVPNDYHLLDNSPAIDTGTNSAPDLPAQDFFGNPRIAAGRAGDAAIVDMGIDEVPAMGGKPPTAKLEVSPKTLQFAETAIGQMSKSERVELSNPRSNRQDTPIMIEGVAVSGPFVVDAAGSTCHAGASLASNGQCRFALSYMPTASTEQSGTFTINNNSTAGQAVVVLKGKGRQ